jgi:ketosteroid isomerase-like protein
MAWRSSCAVAALVLAAPIAASAKEAAPAALEERVQRLEDVAAIQRILVEYSARIDARDFTGYAALFAREGTWQNGATVRRGREEIQAMLVGLFGTPEAGYVNREDYHLVSNPQVDVQGDRATARSRHLLVMRGENGQPQPMLAGLYEDEFVREDGEWKILRRVDHPVMPTAEEWLEIIAERNAH